MTDRHDRLREIFANARVVAWVCPVEEHGNRRGVVTVDWDDGVAHCTFSGCGRTSRPQRIQQSRTPGWRKPLGAVSVTRATHWGNSWKVLDKPQWGYPALTVVKVRRRYPAPAGAAFRGFTDKPTAAAFAVELFRRELLAEFDREPASAEYFLGPLAGHDLMCFCPIGQPCHADALLEMVARHATTRQGSV